jgi:hypothetical protein
MWCPQSQHALKLALHTHGVYGVLLYLVAQRHIVLGVTLVAVAATAVFLVVARTRLVHLPLVIFVDAPNMFVFMVAW